MIQITREAALAVLDALLMSRQQLLGIQERKRQDEAIATITTAIDAPKQKPFLYQNPMHPEQVSFRSVQNWRELYTTPPEPQAQPASAKPSLHELAETIMAAHALSRDDGRCVGQAKWAEEIARAVMTEPAPQARELSDAEIADCIPDDSDEQFAADPAGFIRNFARAVLAAKPAQQTHIKYCGLCGDGGYCGACDQRRA